VIIKVASGACQARRVERVELCCSTSSTAKMHGLNTSNVSSRVETSQVEFGLITSAITDSFPHAQVKNFIKRFS